MHILHDVCVHACAITSYIHRYVYFLYPFSYCKNVFISSIYVTVPEKRDLVVQNKKIDILMLVNRFNPSLRCVKILNDKTLYARRDGWPNLRYSSRAI